MYWENYNVTASSHPNIYNNLTAGNNYWDNGTYTNCNMTCIKTTSSVSTSVTNGRVYHMIPSQEWWTANTGGSGVAGRTVNFNTSLEQITEANCSVVSRAVYISHIYYPPSETAMVDKNYSQAQYKCLIAHEIGHALGFGHPTDSAEASVMEQATMKNYVSLRDYDRICFNAKYGN